ncbi:MAG: RHS repeat-associated core domain-containing protein [Vicingaceae bacterium]
MGARKLSYFSDEKALEVNAVFLCGVLEKNPPLAKNRIKSYPYGFNSYERLDEVSGSGNSYDFGARIYSPRIGKFFSTDPREKDFPFWSPYLFAGNNPIRYIDEEGKGPGDKIRRFFQRVAIKLDNAKNSFLEAGEKEYIETKEKAEGNFARDGSKGIQDPTPFDYKDPWGGDIKPNSGSPKAKATDIIDNLFGGEGEPLESFEQGDTVLREAQGGSTGQMPEKYLQKSEVDTNSSTGTKSIGRASLKDKFKYKKTSGR